MIIYIWEFDKEFDCFRHDKFRQRTKKRMDKKINKYE